MGFPVGGTCEPDAMPSGEVAPMLGVGPPIPPTCARAEPQPSSTPATVTIAKRVIMASTLSFTAFIAPGPLDDNAIKRPDMASRGLPRLVRCCFDRLLPRRARLSRAEGRVIPSPHSGQASKERAPPMHYDNQRKRHDQDEDISMRAAPDLARSNDLAHAPRWRSRDASMITARRLPGDLPERGGE
jgi:hypothetical protein